MPRRRPPYTKLVLFDIDGTLLMTGGAGKIALEKAFEKVYGISNAWGNVHPDGKTDPLIIQEISERLFQRPLGRLEIKRISDRYLRYFRKEINRSPRFRLLPGVKELIPMLYLQKKYLMGLATGNFEEASWLKLRRGGLHRYFKFGGFGSDSHKRSLLTAKAISRGKAWSGVSFKRKDIVVIGDTPHDIRAGKSLGVVTIAVATGSWSENQLKRFKPDFVVKDFSDPNRLLGILG